MRKQIAVAVAAVAISGTGVAVAGEPATNSQGFFLDLGVKVSPPVAGTVRTPRGVGVSVNSFAGNRINGNLVAQLSSTVVRFNSGFKDNGPLVSDPAGASLVPRSRVGGANVLIARSISLRLALPSHFAPPTGPVGGRCGPDDDCVVGPAATQRQTESGRRDPAEH